MATGHPCQACDLPSCVATQIATNFMSQHSANMAHIGTNQTFNNNMLQLIATKQFNELQTEEAAAIHRVQAAPPQTA